MSSASSQTGQRRGVASLTHARRVGRFGKASEAIEEALKLAPSAKDLLARKKRLKRARKSERSLIIEYIYLFLYKKLKVMLIIFIIYASCTSLRGA